MKYNKRIIGITLAIVLVVTGIVYAGFFRQNPEDCTSVETYDALLGTCYYECTTDQDCADKAKKVEAELDAFFENSQTKIANGTGGQRSPTTPSSTNSSGLLTKEFTGTETDGKIYTIQNDQKLAPEPSSAHDRLWQLFARVAGKDAVARYVQSFEIFDDSGNDSAASVWQSQTANKWHVNVNAAYANDKKDLVHTMIHEYGHILSLNNTQVVGAVNGSCPRLELSEGCTNQDSFIQTFHTKFWQRYGDDVPADEGKDQNEVQEFYDSNSSSFVSEYAATNFVEDWAETWATFVTKAKPSGNQVKDQKVQSMYDIPALVNERNRIRAQIANSL